MKMYESPVKLCQTVEEIAQDIHKQTEDFIVQSVCKVGVVIDKEELIKAINYDRNQYDKGYNEGYNKAIDDALRVMHDTYILGYCSEGECEKVSYGYNCDDCLQTTLVAKIKQLKKGTENE